MFTKSSVFTRKKALAVVFIAALALLALILLRWSGSTRPNLSTQDGREKFLQNLGWEIDASTEEYRRVTLPESFDGVMAEYARMQAEQGLDLSAHCGESCGQYSYILTNYPDCGETVMITLYVQRGRLIAGDIHTSALDGFMHGIFRGSD